MVPGLARDALPRETRVSAPKRAAADVTRPRDPLPRDARLIGSPVATDEDGSSGADPIVPASAPASARHITADVDISLTLFMTHCFVFFETAAHGDLVSSSKKLATLGRSIQSEI